ncbi:MAG: N-acetylmuramoyl-L-alanine amidase [Planctomycetota bacterium]
MRRDSLKTRKRPARRFVAARNSRLRPGVYHRRLLCEVLEDRRLLSATIFSEGFEGAFPGTAWTVNTSQSRMWDDTNYKAHTGSWSGYGAELGGNNATNTYANNMSSYMERTVNLSGYTSASLSFWRWQNTEVSFDYLRLWINGTEVFNRSTSATTWAQHSVNLDAYAGQSNVVIRFGFTSDSNTVPPADSGVWLDDITLTADAATATDYPGATWESGVPVGNYTQASRTPSDIRWIVIHTTESMASSALSWFKNPASEVSAHYLVKRDGTVLQLVRDDDISHHAGNWDYNQKSIGIEHERYNGGELTTAQYQASAQLVQWLAGQYAADVVFPAGIAPASN